MDLPITFGRNGYGCVETLRDFKSTQFERTLKFFEEVFV